MLVLPRKNCTFRISPSVMVTSACTRMSEHGANCWRLEGDNSRMVMFCACRMPVIADKTSSKMITFFMLASDSVFFN
jgi:hypothetical protein